MQAEYNAKKKAFFLSIVEAPPIFANEKENKKYKKYKKNNNDYGIRAHWFFACGLYGLIGLASAPRVLKTTITTGTTFYNSFTMLFKLYKLSLNKT